MSNAYANEEAALLEEAADAIAALRAELETAKQERDAANGYTQAARLEGMEWQMRAEAAEAQVAVLTATLQQIAAHSGDRFALDSEGFPTIRQDSPQAIAAAALASTRQEEKPEGPPVQPGCYHQFGICNCGAKTS